MIIETLLIASVVANVALAAIIILKKTPGKPTPTKPSDEILAILNDMNQGGTHLLISRIDPMDVFHVSPRDRSRV